MFAWGWNSIVDANFALWAEGISLTYGSLPQHFNFRFLNGFHLSIWVIDRRVLNCSVHVLLWHDTRANLNKSLVGAIAKNEMSEHLVFKTNINLIIFYFRIHLIHLIIKYHVYTMTSLVLRKSVQCYLIGYLSIGDFTGKKKATILKKRFLKQQSTLMTGNCFKNHTYTYIFL